MKSFSISQEALSVVTGFCIKGVSPSPIIPAYDKLVMKIKDNVLYMKGYNYKFGVYDSVPIDSGDDMDLAVIGIDFHKIVSSLSGLIEFEFSAMNKTLEMTCGRSVYKLFAEEPINYPIQDMSDAELTLTIDSSHLIGAIQTTSPSIKPDPLRPQMESMYIHRSDDSLKAAGVNMTSLSIDGRLEGYSSDENLDVQIMPYIFSSINGLSGEVNVRQNNKFSEFSDSNNRKVIQIKSMGIFPAYEKVIPSAYNHKFSVDRDDLMVVLNRIALVTNKQNYLVNLKFNVDLLTITGEDMELGKRGVEQVTVDGDGTVEIIINGKQLQELVNSRKTTKLDLLIVSPTMPFKIAGDDNIISVLMPFVI